MKRRAEDLLVLKKFDYENDWKDVFEIQVGTSLPRHIHALH
jgi:hypothetical protein